MGSKHIPHFGPGGSGLGGGGGARCCCWRAKSANADFPACCPENLRRLTPFWRVPPGVVDTISTSGDVVRSMTSAGPRAAAGRWAATGLGSSRGRLLAAAARPAAGCWVGPAWPPLLFWRTRMKKWQGYQQAWPLIIFEFVILVCGWKIYRWACSVVITV